MMTFPVALILSVYVIGVVVEAVLYTDPEIIEAANRVVEDEVPEFGYLPFANTIFKILLGLIVLYYSLFWPYELTKDFIDFIKEYRNGNN